MQFKQEQIWRIAGCLLASLLFSPFSFAQDDDAPKPFPTDATYEIKSFDNQTWEPIIEDFAEQAGLELILQEPPPTGTFTFRGNDSSTFMQTFDTLNESLLQRERLLIRNRDKLVLFDTSLGFPSQLIETIPEASLLQRGRYELLRVEFEMGGLDSRNIRNEIETLVGEPHQEFIRLLPSANLLVVQEMGKNLQQIAYYIGRAREKNENYAVRFLKLNHALPSEVLAASEALLNMEKDGNSWTNSEDSLRLTLTAAPDQILVAGEPDQIKKFEALSKTMDVDLTDPNAPQRETPDYRSYKISGDAVLVYEVLQTVLEGRQVNLSVDDSNNLIHLRARSAEHKIAEEVIQESTGAGDNFEIIRINVLDAEDVIETIDEMFTLEGTESPEDAPQLTETSQNRVIVMGKPDVVARVSRMIKQIDVPFQRESGARTGSRYIRLNNNEQQRVQDVLEYEIPSLVKNRIELVLPDERRLELGGVGSSNIRVFNGEPARKRAPLNRTMPQPEEGSDSKSSDDGSGMKEDGSDTKRDGSDTKQSRLMLPNFQILAWQTMASSNTSMIAWQQEEQESANGTAQTSQEETIITSVDGADVIIKITPAGISLESEDLNALDIIEDAIMSVLSSDVGEEELALFPLENREPMEAKALLEEYLGLDGGGGGGAAGGLINGFVGNALGGAAGGLADAFLGGGGGSAGGLRELAGPVKVVADTKKYTLLVSAFEEDMDFIRDLVELIDSDLIQNPNPTGETYRIHIMYKSLESVEAAVRTHLGALVKADEGGGGNTNPQAEVQRQFARLLTGQGGAAEQEPPTVALSADDAAGDLLVTGPYFLYERIFRFVEEFDQPDRRPPQTQSFVPMGSIEPSALESLLMSLGNDKIQVQIGNEAPAGTQAPGTTPAAGNNRPTGGAAAAGGQQIQNVLRQLQQRTGGGARGRGGAGRGGGGAGRGGGGAGRGGGGAGRGGGGAGRGGGGAGRGR